MSLQRFAIEGGKKLKGEISISGAKNSALPIIAASIISSKKVTLKGVPDLVDVHTMMELVRHFGVKVEFYHNVMKINASQIKRVEAPYEIVRKMRASYYALGALLAREHKAKVSFPGGCAIGPRPIDLHIKGLEALGSKIDIADGFINAHVRKLKGCNVNIQGPKGTSVGATINVLIAASAAEGVTTITPAACEPEVVDVANFLNIIGCNISGHGTHTIRVRGQSTFSGGTYTIIPDRIEAGTFAVAAAISRGKVKLCTCEPRHLTSVLDTLKDIGLKIQSGDDYVIVSGSDKMKATKIHVAPYPGFPTDMQSQFMALCSVVPGTSTIKETIFENRFMQAVELMRMGAHIAIEGDTAVIKGVKQLSGTTLMASDLRASAALVLAGLVAKGKTMIRRIYHLDRGYEKFEHKLRKLGARIKRQSE